MTDQSATTTAAIGIVFPKRRYRLCISHIEKNSKKYIIGLRFKQDFVKVFNHVLKNTNTVSVFEFHCKMVCPAMCAYFDHYVCLILLLSVTTFASSSGVGDAKKVNKKDIARSSVWRRDMLRKFSDLISASELNMNPRNVQKKENESGSSNIKDLVGMCAKRERDVRKKRIVKIKCNQAKGKRKSALKHASRIKIVVQLSITNEALGRIVNALSSGFELSLRISNFSDVETSSTLQTFINFM
ncbi:hypothetical protein M9H77_36461 [Catharanthus roseus]|uniref:Uncharacterized protein n=1 Tax=Catharanthus roseus TaxID=4058 RepID=A0ACB9ZUG1_CATRO|nr:hypothetical protein M9H77_36461 [Catharanthus roseus]